MALAAISYEVFPGGLGGMARGEMGRGLVCTDGECALVREWGNLLPSCRISKSLIFFCLYIDLRNFWELWQLREGRSQYYYLPKSLRGGRIKLKINKLKGKILIMNYILPSKSRERRKVGGKSTVYTG